MKRYWQNQRIYGLRAKTYLNVVGALIFMIIVAVIGRNFRLQELKAIAQENKANNYSQKIKELTTYKKPTLASESEQEKAKYIIKKVWRENYNVGIELARCESGFREAVVNSIGATGYFQINAPVHNVPIEDMKNGWANAGFAYALYKEQGLSPWISSEDCWRGNI